MPSQAVLLRQELRRVAGLRRWGQEINPGGNTTVWLGIAKDVAGGAVVNGFLPILYGERFGYVSTTRLMRVGAAISGRD